MRWDELFDDLAGQVSAAVDGELRAETDERVRAELARATLLDRLSAAGGRVVHVDLVDGERLHGRAAGVGDGWCRLETGRDELLVPVRALARVRSCPSLRRAVPDQPPQLRLGLRPLVRALARRRVYVRLALVGGSTPGGTLEAVGADHLELAEHPADRPCRAADVTDVSLVRFDALLWLRYEGS